MPDIQTISQGNYILANPNAGIVNPMPISAGKDVSIREVNGTLVFGRDETDLYTGPLSGALPISATLSEPYINFDKIELHMMKPYAAVHTYDVYPNATYQSLQAFSPYVSNNGGAQIYAMMFKLDKDSNTLSLQSGALNVFRISANSVTNYSKTTAANVGECQVYKVVGVNRRQV